MRAGVGLGLKRRDLADSDTFLVRDTEVREDQNYIFLLNFSLFQEASVVDQLDLEGKCMRRPRDKRYFRKTGVLTGSAQGRDSAW